MPRAVDPLSDRPVYKQIADDLRDRIIGGGLKPGEKSPNESSLMAEFRVAQGTIRQSLALLRSEGLARLFHEVVRDAGWLSAEVPVLLGRVSIAEVDDRPRGRHFRGER